MKISARNQLAGTVEKVTKGAVNAEINLELKGGEKVAAIITNASAAALKLKKGAAAFAVVKASEVMIGTDMNGAKLSARNVLEGVVLKVQDGAVNSEVVLKLPGGSEVVASITKSSVKRLGLKKGSQAFAVIKASNVMVGV